eukprot:TRINITY_DN50053_c0_g1_i1.p1 TRINITY_DN50053_c0_g1~~TRINITY_DN50053_c0_g1_i1.p1  ORF type:complete len:282 (+),score=38.99 TRINITY_DN50053_c0_g1_i1:82-927(+)
MAYPRAPLSAREPDRSVRYADSLVNAGGLAALGSDAKGTNVLLMRDGIGKPKPSTFCLPGAHFAYGKPGNNDDEGAREVSMRWVSHTPSKSREEDGTDFVSINRRAINEKITNAKDLRHFKEAETRYGHGDMSARGRSSPCHSQPPMRPVIPSDVIPGFTYGRKVRPSTPINEVISARFADRSERALTSFYSEMRDVRAAQKTHVRKIPLTTGTRLRNQSVKKVAEAHEQEQKEPFKLSKFKRVQPKVSSHRKSPLSGHYDFSGDRFSEIGASAMYQDCGQ